MKTDQNLSPCQRFERFWQESLDTPRPRWDEYWFDVAWSDHLATCEHCRKRNQRYRRLAQALEQWNPQVGEVPDLSESSLKLWKERGRVAYRVEAAPVTQAPAGFFAPLVEFWNRTVRRRP